MGDFDQLRKQQQQQMEVMRQAEQQMQQNTSLQQNQQAYTTKESMDVQAVEETISANKYLQSQRDADAAEPDENREELLKNQMTIGLGKAKGIQKAHEDANS